MSPSKKSVVQKVAGPLFFPFGPGGTEPVWGRGGKDKGGHFGVLSALSRAPTVSPFLLTELEHLPGSGPFLHVTNQTTGPRCPRSPGAVPLRDKGQAYTKRRGGESRRARNETFTNKREGAQEYQANRGCSPRLGGERRMGEGADLENSSGKRDQGAAGGAAASRKEDADRTEVLGREGGNSS